ncbi:MAG: toll/interleukin-1 receptor domain-containing protein [Bryobacterales bacterium]|nr:toll/interleukin-1 receptor domain-containing protein [Bryobacterales bacterium]
MSICCSSRGAVAGKRLAERLERNLGVSTLLVAEDQAPVWQTWEEGAAADAVLILLDKNSAPAPMRRDDWAALIDHDNDPPIAFARLEECTFPKLLERRPFFPATDMAEFERAVERWVTRQLPLVDGISAAAFDAPAPAEWWAELVDKPGRVTTADIGAAQAFAHAAADHFQGVVWLGCAGREAATVRAELDYRTGEGRVLAVLAHVDKELRLPESRHSYLQVLGPPPAGEASAALGCCYAPRFPGWLARELGGNLAEAVALDAGRGTYRMARQGASDDATRTHHLQILHRCFRNWKDTPEPCRELLPEVAGAIGFGFARHWSMATEVCLRAAFLLLRDGRRREGIRTLHRLLVEAEVRGDSETAETARHELSWLNEDDEPARAETMAGEQLALNLFG